jgi:hypothetical protein
MQDGTQTPESNEHAPVALTDPAVVEALGGDNVALVMVYNVDGTTQAFCPNVPSNRVVANPFDNATIWEEMQSRFSEAANSWSGCSGFSIERDPGNAVLWLLRGGFEFAPVPLPRR